jgi:hypothetical protein
VTRDIHAVVKNAQHENALFAAALIHKEMSTAAAASRHVQSAYANPNVFASFRTKRHGTLSQLVQRRLKHGRVMTRLFWTEFLVCPGNYARKSVFALSVSWTLNRLDTRAVNYGRRPLMTSSVTSSR